MKLEGIVNVGRNKGTLVVRRPLAPNGRIVFHFEAVESLDEFYKLCPEPMPREVILPGGERKYALDEPKYKREVTEHIKNRHHYIFLKSLVMTEPAFQGWETVQWDEPDTWGNYEGELQEFGLNFAEIGRLRSKSNEINAMTDSAFDEALEDFLAGRPDRGHVSSRKDEQGSTASSEPVNALEETSPATPENGTE